MSYSVKVSLGEILDKLSILEIKLSYAEEAVQIDNIKRELLHLETITRPLWDHNEGRLKQLYENLKSTNKKLWSIEDQLRLKEQEQDFGAEFVALARSVYITNDQRAETKKQINKLLNSEFVEEKIYSNPNYAL